MCTCMAGSACSACTTDVAWNVVTVGTLPLLIQVVCKPQFVLLLREHVMIVFIFSSLCELYPGSNEVTYVYTSTYVLMFRCSRCQI